MFEEEQGMAARREWESLDGGRVEGQGLFLATVAWIPT